MAFINFSVRISALEFCREITAQIAAGIQPIKVICKIKQIIAVKILPLNKKERDGKNIAISVIILLWFIVIDQSNYYTFQYYKVFFKPIKKACKIILCRLSNFIVTLTVQNSNHLLEDLKILIDL